jgi:CubicO group peptidase (beta-lactamase class C family)
VKARGSTCHGGSIIALALILCAAPPSVHADQRFDDVARKIERAMQAEGLPSVAVAVAKDGQIIWEAAFGWADRERRVRATPTTPYSLASISKPFTATAIMKLVHAGRIALDRPANDYLGDGKITPIGQASKATVRRLLSHSAGLPIFYLAEHDLPRRLPADEVIAKYAIIRQPQGRYTYSNLGYGILERIIERVSGARFDEYMRSEIFAPLRLGAASVPLEAPPAAAVRYEKGVRPLPFYDLAHRGASSVYASAHDLARFGMFHLKERRADLVPLLTRRTIDEMQRVHTSRTPAGGYGLGWTIDEDAIGLRRIGHHGGMPGVSTILTLFPSERLVVVVLTNTRNAAIVPVADDIADAALPHYAWRRRLARLTSAFR